MNIEQLNYTVEISIQQIAKKGSNKLHQIRILLKITVKQIIKQQEKTIKANKG